MINGTDKRPAADGEDSGAMLPGLASAEMHAGAGPARQSAAGVASSGSPVAAAGQSNYWPALAAALVGFVLLSQLALYVLTFGNPLSRPSKPAVAAAPAATSLPAPAAKQVPVAPTTAAAPVVETQVAADTSVFELLSTSVASPRGVAIAGVNPVRSLELAQAHLSGASGERDTDEGAFWLKHYITTIMGNELSRRALTQLGSSYAEPVGRAPDFAKARQVWELASALGDPVAMCFLGTLHEYGIGVTADKVAAGQWYGRAQRAGGCPDLDKAMARVRE